MRKEEQIKKQYEDVVKHLREHIINLPTGTGTWTYLTGYKNALEYVLNYI